MNFAQLFLKMESLMSMPINEANMLTKAPIKQAETLNGAKDKNDNFSKILEASFSEKLKTDRTTENQDVKYENAELSRPSWVDPDYFFDPENPRKPNMRELMQSLSGRKLEDLYNSPADNWKTYSTKASEMLYGVIGSRQDTRDWQAIMKSDDILSSARIETAKMHEPTVDIESKFDEDSNLIDQYAVLKNKSGEVLRVLEGTGKYVEEMLDNYGVSDTALSDNLIQKITFKDFNTEVKNLLLSKLEHNENLSNLDFANSDKKVIDE